MITILIVIYVVFISLGLPDSLFGVSWPVVHTEFAIDESFASVYSIITGICTGGVSFVSGKLIRKFGTARVTFYSIILTAIGLAGMSFSKNIFVMIIFSIILGYGAGAIDTGLNNFVSLHYKAHHMNWLHCFWGLGVTVSPMIMSYFLGNESSSWRNGYRAVTLIQLLIAFFVFLALSKWKKIEKNTVPEISADQNASDASFLSIIKIKGVLTSILSLGLYCSMEFLLGTWGASYIVNVFALSPDVAAKWVSLYFGGIMLGRIVAGFVSMKLSDKWLIRAGIVISFMGILTLFLPLGSNCLFGLLLIGFGFGPVFPSVLHSVPERFGIAYSADITGYHMGGAYAIGFFVQLVYGFIAANTTFLITPFVLSALSVSLFLANETTLRKVKRANKHR